MDMLLLTTTSQHGAFNEKVILDGKNLRKWIDELPRQDIIRTVTELHQAIENFNQISLENKLQIRILQIYYSHHHGLLRYGKSS